MSDKIVRIFHPVGQGAFYSEEFIQNNKVVFRVIYDCGCKYGKICQAHGQKILKKAINEWGEHPKVDYLFISHFDLDHVSLVKTLRDEDVHVRKVILPLLTKKEQEFLVEFYDMVHVSIPCATVVKLLITTPGEIFGSETKVIWVRPIQGDMPNRSDFADNNQAVQNVDSGTRFSAGRNQWSDWRYIPHNYECDGEDRSSQLRSWLTEEFRPEHIGPDDLQNLSNLLKLWDDKKRHPLDRIKKVYDKLDGKINRNSMVVYSGPISNQNGSELHECTNINCRFNDPVYRLNADVMRGDGLCRRGPACVYTGDVDLKQAKIRDWFSAYWDRVGTIQVPHHGSATSFCFDNTNPFSDGGYCCPISCSNRHFYGHPHDSVIHSLSWDRNVPIRITETNLLTQEISLPTEN